MVELKRIYWSRQALRLAYSAVLVWLAVSVLLALMPKGKRRGWTPCLNRQRGPSRLY